MEYNSTPQSLWNNHFLSCWTIGYNNCGFRIPGMLVLINLDHGWIQVDKFQPYTHVLIGGLHQASSLLSRLVIRKKHQGIISPVYLSISIKHQGKSPVWLSLSLWYLDDWCLSPVWLPAFIIRIKHQGIMSPVWLSAWPIPTWNPSLQPRCRHCPRSSLSPTRSQWYVYLRAKNKNFFLQTVHSSDHSFEVGSFGGRRK